MLVPPNLIPNLPTALATVFVDVANSRILGILDCKTVAVYSIGRVTGMAISHFVLTSLVARSLHAFGTAPFPAAKIGSITMAMPAAILGVTCGNKITKIFNSKELTSNNCFNLLAFCYVENWLNHLVLGL